jgi:hypothetical protein
MPPLTTLIPNSGIQFWDIDFDIETLPRLTRSFWEEPISQVPDENGDYQVVLHDLLEDENGTPIDRAKRIPPADQVYTIRQNQAIEMHLGRWVPLPYFLVTAPGLHGAELYDRGPTNWARLRIAEHPHPGAGRSHRLTLAFDTLLLPRGKEGPYLGPSSENSERQQEFAFVPSIEANSWFLDEAWIGEWLRQMLLEHRTEQRRGRALRKEDMPSPCEHYARYLVLLELLDSLDQFPRVKVLDVVSGYLPYDPVDVDLVLDIGNTRTCGILIEEHPGEGLNLADSYELSLRELSRPELTHVDPFASRAEFARPSFGPEAISRRSGRPSAFTWPSPARVGPEAVRLAGERTGTEGASGLSSPKRYLWDDRPSRQGWRFNGRASDGVTTDPPISGPFMALVTETGGVLGQRGFTTPAARARFSRQSIFTFMLTEILLQAMNQMNAPGNRARRRDADKPRRLRSVLMTMPPGMPVAEQRILRDRSQDAVRLAWAMLGMAGKPGPVVKADLDEASATQIVWLHNEVSERLQGDAKALMEMAGRMRPTTGQAPSLRLASIDIGGGTTDLMITTYTLSGDAIVPRQEFRESFKIAGDDVLERIITRVVLPAFATALGAAGINEPQALLTRKLGQDQGGQDEQERHLRRLFVSMVLEPIGIAVLRAYEQVEDRTSGEVLRSTVAELLGSDFKSAGRALAYLDAAAAAAGAAGFQTSVIEIIADTRRIEPVVSGVLGPVLADLCEVVWSYDCDALLLSGRPSRMRVVTDMVLAKAPVPPHRVIGMHRYRVGERYPFRDAANRIKDPKTTAAVGAALSVQAEGRLRNFTLRARALAMRSTARFIGKMFNDGQITNDNVLLSDLDLDSPPAEDSGFMLDFQSITQIGFRQLPIERWTATPRYVMEFANPDNAKSFDLPLRVKVRRAQPKGLPRPSRGQEEEDPDQEIRETFVIEEISDAEGASQQNSVVRLRLQTLDDQEGYWRDTGRLSLG